MAQKQLINHAAIFAALTLLPCQIKQACAEQKADPPAITVTIDGDLISVDGMRTSLQDFSKLIALKREAFEKAGHDLNEVTVIIRADKATPAGAIQRLIHTLQENKFEKFALRAKEKPPLRVHLLANDDGSLKSMRVGKRLIKDFAALTEHVKQLVADKAIDEVELACDEKLTYNIVVQCITAVSGYRNDGGELVTLIRNIKFAQPKQAPGESFKITMPKPPADDNEPQSNSN